MSKSIIKILFLFIGILTLTFSGINWYNGIAAWLAPIFLLLFTRKASWYQMLLFFVVVCFSGGLSMTSNNFLQIPAINIFNGIGFGILTTIPYIVDKLLYKKHYKFYYSLIFPTAVTLVEFTASLAIGTWGSMAHTQYECKALMQLSSVTGIYGIWFIIAWLASLTNWIIENKDKRPQIIKASLIYGSILTIVLVNGFGSYKSKKQTKKSVKVATVISETNIHEIATDESEELKLLATDFAMQIPNRIFSDSLAINTLIKRTQEASRKDAKIIVWNEIALILNQNQKKRLIEEISLLCAQNKVYVLLAFLEQAEHKNIKPFNNKCVFISPKGKVLWEYKKSYLEPFAEALIVNAGNFDIPVVKTEYGSIGSVICADLDINYYITQAGKKNIDILLVPAFDWAEITPLHSQMASIQAIQFGCNIVRANGNGLSAIYNYKGKEIASLNSLISNKKILFADLPTQSANTIYAKTGNWLIYLCLAFFVFILVQSIFYIKI